ncbi:MAG: hypothetical protein AUG75_06070 [Cyanobacteria bacterium 13_1_20CM_4_61_6]|nr:MAG: hypothetical protein AUG75_06070 [Cyanobacteria bacterium 13_1_20CM_4_61_6]
MKTRSAIIRGAHAPSRIGFGAFAETIFFLASGKVRDGDGAIASTRGACAPQKIIPRHKA